MSKIAEKNMRLVWLGRINSSQFIRYVLTEGIVKEGLKLYGQILPSLWW